MSNYKKNKVMSSMSKFDDCHVVNQKVVLNSERYPDTIYFWISNTISKLHWTICLHTFDVLIMKPKTNKYFR